MACSLLLRVFTLAALSTIGLAAIICPPAFNNLGTGSTGMLLGSSLGASLNLATGWTTGNSGPYTFESASVYLLGSGTVTVGLFAGGTNTPSGSTLVANLVTSYSVSAGTFTLFTFKAPGGSLSLNSNTNYWILISSPNGITWRYTNTYSSLLPTAYTGTAANSPWSYTTSTSQKLSLMVNGCDYRGGCTLPSCNVAYKFIAQNAGKSVHLYGPQTTDDTVLNTWDAMGGVPQESYYYLPNSDGSYYITSKFSGKMIDIRTSVATSSIIVQNKPNFVGDAQKWILKCAAPGNIFNICPKANTTLTWNVSGNSFGNGAWIWLWYTPETPDSQFLMVPW